MTVAMATIAQIDWHTKIFNTSRINYAAYGWEIHCLFSM